LSIWPSIGVAGKTIVPAASVPAGLRISDVTPLAIWIEKPVVGVW